MLEDIQIHTSTHPLVAKTAGLLRRSRSASEIPTPRRAEVATISGHATPSGGFSSVDAMGSAHDSGLNGALRARLSGDIMALDANYKANLSHMGRRGARTGMLAGAIAGTVIGITLAALSFGVGIPLIGIAAGIGGQIVGFFIGLVIERVLQWRFARRNPEVIERLRTDAAALRATILQAAATDRTYDPEKDLRSLDLFLHNLNGTAKKAILELFSGLFRESPGVVFEVVRDVRQATENGIKRVPLLFKRKTEPFRTLAKAQ